MKKTMIILVLVLAAIFALRVPTVQAWQTWTSIVAAERSTNYGRWHELATFSAAGVEPDALAVTERTYATIAAAIAAAAADEGDEEIVLFKVPYGANAVRIRAIGVTTKTATTNILTGCLGSQPAETDCEMALRGTLSWVMGTQTSATGTYVLADECTLTAASDAASTSSWTIADPGDAVETVAEALLDLQGDNVICVNPTALNDDAVIQLKFY